MRPHPAPSVAHLSRSETGLRRLLTIWVGQQAAGVSLLSWSAYLASAILWFWFGIQKRDKNIYLPCIGWIALDSAVIAGIFIYG